MRKSTQDKKPKKKDFSNQDFSGSKIFHNRGYAVSRVDFYGAHLFNADLSGAAFPDVGINNQTKLKGAILSNFQCRSIIWKVVDSNAKTIASLIIDNPKEFLDEFIQQLYFLDPANPFIKELVLFRKQYKTSGDSAAILFLMQHIETHPGGKVEIVAKRTYYKSYKTQQYKKLTESQSLSTAQIDRLEKLAKHLHLPKIIAPYIPPGTYDAYKAQIQEFLYVASVDKNHDEKRTLIKRLLDLADHLRVRRDLSGLDLSGADLTGFDLSATDLRKANLNQATLTGSTIDRHTDLRGAILNRVILDDSRPFTFQHYCRDSVAYKPIKTTPSTFNRKLFTKKINQRKSNYLEKLQKNTELSGGEKFLLALRHSQTVVTSFIKDHRSSATQARMEDAFAQIALTEDTKRKIGEIIFLDKEAHYYYQNWDLREAKFEDMRVIGQCHLTGAALNRTQVFQILAIGYGEQSKGSKLKQTDLSGLNLSKLNFSNVDLHNANLRGSDLSGANLCGADLRGADLRGANLKGVDLTNAKFDCNTKFDENAFTSIKTPLTDKQTRAVLIGVWRTTTAVAVQSNAIMQTPTDILTSVIVDMEKIKTDHSLGDSQKAIHMAVLLFEFFNAVANQVKVMNQYGEITKNVVGQSADVCMPCLETILRLLDSENLTKIQDVMEYITQYRELLEDIFGNSFMGYRLAMCESLNQILQERPPDPLVRANFTQPIIWCHEQAVSHTVRVARLLDTLTHLISSNKLGAIALFRCKRGREILLDMNNLEKFKVFNQQYDQFLQAKTHADFDSWLSIPIQNVASNQASLFGSAHACGLNDVKKEPPHGDAARNQNKQS